MQSEKKRYNIDDIIRFITTKTKCGNLVDFCKTGNLIPGNDKKEQWLSCYISAFANSNGGTVIFGIKTERGRAFEIDLVNFKNVSSFWLKTLLENEISPIIENLDVYEVADNNNVESGFIVVKIPKSPHRPHMASDNRFYQRVGNKTEMMQEQRVRELYNLASVSEMEFVGIINTQGVPTLENSRIVNMNFYPKFLVRNAGSSIEKYFKFELWLPSDLHDTSFLPLQNYFNRLEEKFSVFSVPNRQPVFQNEICNILEAKLFVNNENIQSFNKGEMLIKLFYSRGIKEFNYNLQETFTYENKFLSVSDFVKTALYEK